MSEGSLGLRTRSYGSLQPQPHNSDLLPIQSTSVSALKPPKMLPFGSRDKEKIILQWICKLCGKRKVGMVLLLIASVAVFLSFISVLNKGITKRRFEENWSDNGAKGGKWSNEQRQDGRLVDVQKTENMVSWRHRLSLGSSYFPCLPEKVAPRRQN